jgi:hypothetical protein
MSDISADMGSAFDDALRRDESYRNGSAPMPPRPKEDWE